MIIVAEIGASHQGSLDTALDTIKAAKESGADAVKFQTFDPVKMAIPGYVLFDGPWKGRELVDLYKEAETPKEWHIDLFSYAEHLGLIPFSTPFDKESLEFLESIGCEMYKIASFEIIDLELVAEIAKKGKPIIMSTGMASREEIITAVNMANSYGNYKITLLHCVSEYPAPIESMNLNTMIHMKTMGCNVGLSDHTKGITSAVAATVLGASVIEKHITLEEKGLDGGFALTPPAFKEMADACRNASLAMGEVAYGTGNKELRRSLYFARDMKKGQVVGFDDIKTARPALGTSPLNVGKVVGMKILENVRENDPVRL